jgi:hypothetical protein
MGVTGDGEFLDVIASKVQPSRGLIEALASTLPAGIFAVAVQEVGMGLPSLPAAVRWADYEVDIANVSNDEATAAITNFLEVDTVPWEDVRGEKIRHYDLRPLVASISLDDACGGGLHLSMRLRCAADGVGRADQVTKALGLPAPSRIHRRRLLLAEESPAHAAWRRRGRYL